LNSNPRQFHFVFLLPLFHLENHVCLSRGVQVAGAAWCAATRIMTGVGDLVQRTGDGRIGQVLVGRAIERSGGAVYSLHHACGDDEHGFLGLALKPRSTVCEWFGLKTTHTIFAGLASKPVATASGGLASKPDAMVFLQFGFKTGGDCFSWFGLKTDGRFLG
jgi:hypothetical protein